MDYSFNYIDEEEDTWAENMDQDLALEPEEDQDTDHGGPEGFEDESAGKYHCKSALRDHLSNMKLNAYRRDFQALKNISDVNHYTDDYLFVLPRLYTCFFTRTTDINGLNTRDASSHRNPCPKFQNYLKKVIDMIEQDKYRVMGLFTDELTVLGWNSIGPNKIRSLFDKISDFSIRMSPLILLFNVAVICTNLLEGKSIMEDNTIMAHCPFIKYNVPQKYYKIFFNQHLIIESLGTAIRLKCGIYDQIMQQDLFLNLSDKIQERNNVHIYAMIKDTLSSCEITSSIIDKRITKTWTEVVTDIIKLGDDACSRWKNEGFLMLSKFEAYVVASIVTNDDPDLWDSEEFMRNLTQDDRENLTIEQYDYNQKIVEYLRGLPIRQLCELHGLWRIWGHPIINLEAGLIKMEKTATTVHLIDKNESRIGERTYKSIYFGNYHKKHRFYPLNSFSPEGDFDIYRPFLNDEEIEMYQQSIKSNQNTSGYIFECLRLNKFIDEKNPRYRHKDWDSVVIMRHYKVSSSMNLATMIKDKAITMDRDELVDAVKKRRTVFDRFKRRGILKWLGLQVEKVTSFLTEIDKSGIPDNECIIGLYPKEREMKVQARFFSLMSYKIRMYVTITEELISKLILPYFPMITMSDNLLQMMTRLYNMTAPIGESDNSITYCMNIDFSKWNQNMRKETNSFIFNQIDRCLGYKRLINYTHDLFKKCYLYLCSGEYLPTIVDNTLTEVSPFSRTGDGSGKEGLRQKGWTITTVCDIKSLAYKHNVMIELIGGGDNQVLTVKIPLLKSKMGDKHERESVKRRMSNFRDDLGKKMKKRGLPLKIEETWISPCLLMYNKIMYYNRVPLSSTLKTASRCFPFSNEGVMTFGNIFSTLGTSYQSISSRDTSPIGAMLFSRVSMFLNCVYLFVCNPITKLMPIDRTLRSLPDSFSTKNKNLSMDEKLLYIRRQGYSSLSTNRSINFDTFFISSLFYHKIFGGLSIGTPYSLIMKGFPDPLSECLTYNYKVIAALSDPWYKKIITNITKINLSKKKNWEHLIEDPVSVNHDAPQHGLSRLRMEAEKALRSYNMKNIEFKKLLETGDNSILKNLCNGLSSANVLEPRILHDIVSATIPGYVNSITSKVDKSTTINKMTTTSSTVIETVLSEFLYLKFISHKSAYPSGHEFTCPTKDAQRLRNFGWGKEVIGVTVPHPAAFLVRSEHSSSSPICDMNYIAVFKKMSDFDPMKRGSYRPYFGSYTAEKFKMNEMASAFGEEDILKRSVKIQKLIHWRFKPDSMMGKIIKAIFSSVTDADADMIEPDIGDITGDVQHRYHDMATKHGGIPSNLFTEHSYVTASTSTFQEHSKGAKNENIHFQSCLIFCINSALMDRRTSYDNVMYHFHECCSQCITELKTPTEEELSPNTQIELVASKSNPLLYIREEDIPMHFHIAKKLQKLDMKNNYPLDPIVTRSVGELSCILDVAKNIVNHSPIKGSFYTLFCPKLTDDNISMLIKMIILGVWANEPTEIPPYHTSILSKCLQDHGQSLASIFKWIPATTDLFEPPSTFHSIDDDTIMLYMSRCWNSSPLLHKGEARSNIAGDRWRTSIMIHLLLLNPCCLTCSNCFSIIQASVNNKSHMSSCGVHGEVETKVPVVSMSLDRMIKDLGSLPDPTRFTLIQGKRKNRNDDHSPQIKTKRTNYPDLCTTMRLLKYDVTGDIRDEETHLSYPNNPVLYLSPDKCRSYYAYSMLWKYVIDVGLERLILEYPEGPGEMEDCMSSLCSFIKSNFTLIFYCKNPIDLESINMGSFDEQKYKWGKRNIILKSVGDRMLQPTKLYSDENGATPIAIKSPSFISELNNMDVILLLSEDSIDDWVEALKNKRASKFIAVMNEDRNLEDQPILILGGGMCNVTESFDIGMISPRLIKECISMQNRSNVDFFNNLMMEPRFLEGDSYRMFLNDMRIDVPIISEETLKINIKKLISMLSLQRFISKRYRNNWYDVAILTTTLGLLTLTRPDSHTAYREIQYWKDIVISKDNCRLRVIKSEQKSLIGKLSKRRLFEVNERYHIEYRGLDITEVYMLN